ncbi:MAG: EAL domain-containing protein [Rhodocyclales bacterium]|nr:EAL domain-containing protein [Rhodocyclales bacterium]
MGLLIKAWRRLKQAWCARTVASSSRNAELPLASLMDSLDGMLFRCLIDEFWTLVYVSEGCRSLSGFRREELLGNPDHSLEMLTHPEDRDAVRATIMAALDCGTGYSVEYRIVARDGTEKWVLERGIASELAGQGRVIEGYLEDITDLVMAQIQLAETELRYRSIFENSVVGMFQSTESGRYLAANQALATLYRYPTPEALVSSLENIGVSLYVDPRRRDDFKRAIQAHGRVVDFESEVVRRDGERIWISENAHAVRNASGELLYYEGVVEDITERHRYQTTLRHQATHDPLTSLPNRNLLVDSLQQVVASHGRALLAFVDLDNFKVINDSLGHAVGDQLLVEIARRLRAALGSADRVFRYGGDEFVLMLADSDEAQVAPQLAAVQAAVQASLDLAGHVLHVGCSIGVSCYPDDAGELDELLRLADMAMYRAKASGKGNFCRYSAELDRVAQERFVLEAALSQAIAESQFSVSYQPKVGADGRLRGFEALVRWERPEHGVVPPDRFVPLAEETGQILQIGAMVLASACHEAASWPRCHGRDLGIAVNLSMRQLRDPGLLAQVSEVLRLSGLAPQRLELEITESMLMEDVEAMIVVLDKLRQLGVKIAVDDFGTGYSSMSYLQRLPVDTLKIDRSFVAGCDRDSKTMAIPRAVIFLGRSLGLHLVAEGIEHPGEWEALRVWGCEAFQGFFFSPPIPASGVAEFIATSDRYELI